MNDTDEAGRKRWGARWDPARAGWIAKPRNQNATGGDEAAGARVTRTLSDQEWEAALRSRVAGAADEVLWDLSISTGRRRLWLVPTTRMPADVLRTLRQPYAAQGLRLSSTVLPDVGIAVGPASRARWEDAARHLADEAQAQLPQ